MAGSRHPHPRAGLRSVALVALGALGLSACGGSDEPVAEAAATTTAPATTTTAPATTTTTVAPTTTTTTTTSTTTTTFPEATVSRSEPLMTGTVATTAPPIQQPSEPIRPPSDTHAQEPVIPMGTLSIPKIDVSMTMYSGIRMTTLDRGPGHWPGTALPGDDGNVVVGGHRTSKHRVFRNVDQLAAGDEIIFDDDRGRHVYSVRSVQVVDPSDVWIINPTPTPTATLFACHPPGSVRQRIVVFADLVSG